MNKDYLPILILVPVALIITIALLNAGKNKTSTTVAKTGEVPPAVAGVQTTQSTQTTPAEVSKDYTVTLKTSEGDIKLLLTGSKTPKTADNFVKLAKSGFYDNTIFHRVMEGFMIQGGDPNGDGTGGPGYTFEDEPFDGSYSRGTIAMANRGPDTNGSQFFIMHKDYALPKNYVIFGQVIEGLEVVDKIATAEVTVSPMGENSKPVNPVKVLSVEVIE